MILSDRDIRERVKNGSIKIAPFNIEEQLGAARVDLRLGNQFRTFRMIHKAYVDLAEDLDPDTDLFELKDDQFFILHPGEFVLGVTLEKVELPNDLAARIDGRSSLGRLGIIVHSTAGHVDPGWKGRLTLEISNIGKLPVALRPGMKFCKLLFEMVSSPVEKPYRGRYSGSAGPTASKIREDFEK